MSQHDMTIDNANGPNSRADINLALKALASNNSGASNPATMYANMDHFNTATNLKKMRNADNDDWITLFSVDQATNKATAAGGFESDTSMVFNQAAAPTGWTIDDNSSTASLVIGNTYGSGGSDSPTSWTTALSNDAVALNIADLAAHTHSDGTLSIGGGSHSHDSNRISEGYGSIGGIVASNAGTNGNGSVSSGSSSYNTTTDASHAHTVGGDTGSTGSGSTHNHTMNQDTYTPRYQIMITATRD